MFGKYWSPVLKVSILAPPLAALLDVIPGSRSGAPLVELPVVGSAGTASPTCTDPSIGLLPLFPSHEV